MATTSGLLAEIFHLLQTKAKLTDDLDELTVQGTAIEKQFAVQVAMINVALSSLPAIINTLLIEEYPV